LVVECGILKEVIQLFAVFLHTWAKLFTLSQNGEVKNAGGVFLSPGAWGLFLRSITFVPGFWKPERLF